ncbi:MAG: hypothetical protein NXI13_13855 [Proteobacteria bacterium]|nr:hypothetical protein [Pseudomonadota bacterium]
MTLSKEEQANALTLAVIEFVFGVDPKIISEAAKGGHLEFANQALEGLHANGFEISRKDNPND